MARLSLAQQIADLDVPAPADVDPEAIFSDLHTGSADASRAHYVDVGRSTLRKPHDNIADPKYDGVKVSRKQLLEDDDGSSRLDDEEEDGEEDEEEQEEQEAGPQQSDEDSSESAEEQIATPEESADITISLRKTQDEDRKKGLAVSQQIGIWDSLLDARILLQKSVNSSNAFPGTSQLPHEDPRYQDSLNRTLNEAVLLSEELFELQESLLEASDSITPPVRKRRRIEREDSMPQSDLKAYLDEACEDTSQLEHMCHPHLVQTLSKWSSKIQAVAPSVLLPSNRNAFSKDRQHLKTAVQLVDENLAFHEKLLSRTQQWRGKSRRLGVEVRDGVEPEMDVEIFDDTDFYQQLLRDVIDSRDAAGTNDWMVIQKQKKAKKVVDTKASKGRKLRFDVHEKIQNFVAPIHVKGTWHEEQIDELFSSLLGKGYEDAINLQVDDILPERMEELPSGALKEFKVFG